MVAQERNGRKVVLPVWHNITKDDMAKYSPTLADRLAKRSDSDLIEDIVSELEKLLGEE